MEFFFIYLLSSAGLISGCAVCAGIQNVIIYRNRRRNETKINIQDDLEVIEIPIATLIN